MESLLSEMRLLGTMFIGTVKVCGGGGVVMRYNLVEELMSEVVMVEKCWKVEEEFDFVEIVVVFVVCNNLRIG